TPWGADVDRFTPRPTQRPPDHQPTVVFVGSFRAWHGVAHGVKAARLLLEQGVNARFLFVGHGPEFTQVTQLAGGHPNIVFTGAQPYAAMPAILASADIGIAPFDTHAHPALQAAGFFWSPLKIHEYMATALPVITSDITPLNQIVRHQHEGLLVPEADVPALAEAIATLLADPQRAQQLGAAGRERVVAHYSWQQHCAELEHIMQAIVVPSPKST
ncbi:MAG: glycosyltransferase, partial [Chloroflexi bacterium]